MWQSCRKPILALLIVAATAAGARPRVAVTAAVDVPFTKRWEKAGLLQNVTARVVAEARARLAQFQYLDWTPGTPVVTLRFVVREDPLARGAKPWQLVIERAGFAETHPLPLADAIQVHNLSRGKNLQAAADEVIALVGTALDVLLTSAGSHDFVKTVLQDIDLASTIQPLGPHVEINVPATELKAREETLLQARFPAGPAQANLTLQHLGPPLDVSKKDSHSECSVIADDVQGTWGAYLKGTDPLVFVTRYYPVNGVPQRGNTKTGRR
jgi:hypothetical protein